MSSGTFRIPEAVQHKELPFPSPIQGDSSWVDLSRAGNHMLIEVGRGPRIPPHFIKWISKQNTEPERRRNRSQR